MKKFFLLVAVALCATTVANAQSFNVGDQNITATVGIGGGYGTPIAVSYEKGYMALDNGMVIGVGGYLGWAGYTESYGSGTYGGKYTYSNIFLAAEGNLHFYQKNKLDVYAGLRLGYNVASSSFEWNDSSMDGYDVPSASAGGFIYTAHIGLNYDLNGTYAVNVEAGYGLASLAIGVTYKF